MRTVGRRKRYPKKAAKILEMTYNKNRKSLSELQVKTEKGKIDLSKLEVNGQDLTESYETVSKKLKLCQDKMIDNKDKANRIVDAYKILKNVEDAAQVKNEVMKEVRIKL